MFYLHGTGNVGSNVRATIMEDHTMRRQSEALGFWLRLV